LIVNLRDFIEVASW